MTRILRVFHFVFSLQLLLICGATISFGQVDPTKALIGTWEGQVQVAKQMGRALTINSVKAKGDCEWVARGRYAIEGLESKETTGGQAMNVSSKDNEIYIELTTGNSQESCETQAGG